MDMEIEPAGAAGPAASPRETELESKLSKRTLLLAVFVALSLTELLVMIELLRKAS